jgi:hypothetical protein
MSPNNALHSYGLAVLGPPVSAGVRPHEPDTGDDDD